MGDVLRHCRIQEQYSHVIALLFKPPSYMYGCIYHCVMNYENIVALTVHKICLYGVLVQAYSVTSSLQADNSTLYKIMMHNRHHFKIIINLKDSCF